MSTVNTVYKNKDLPFYKNREAVTNSLGTEQWTLEEGVNIILNEKSKLSSS